MNVVINTAPFMDDMERKVKRVLHVIGQNSVNQCAATAPVITGLYKNSMRYRLKDGFKSPFGSGGKSPSEESSIGAPEDEHVVRVGSGIVYANSVERKRGTVANALDEISVHVLSMAEEELSRDV